MALKIQNGPNWSVRISPGSRFTVTAFSCANYPLPAVTRQGSATHLTQTPGVKIGIKVVRVGEVEAVVAAVNINQTDDVASVPLHCDSLQPGSIRRCVGVRLKLQEDHRAGKIHERVSVQGVRTEITNSGDDGTLWTLAEVRVRRAYVAVYQRRRDRALSEVGV